MVDDNSRGEQSTDHARRQEEVQKKFREKLDELRKKFAEDLTNIVFDGNIRRSKNEMLKKFLKDFNKNYNEYINQIALDSLNTGANDLFVELYKHFKVFLDGTKPNKKEGYTNCWQSFLEGCQHMFFWFKCNMGDIFDMRNGKNDYVNKPRQTPIAIDPSSFYGWRYLRSVDIPDNIKFIKKQAFSCSSITSIRMNNVEEIGILCFQECHKLESIEMPKVTKIPEGIDSSAFAGCIALKSIYMPEVTRIPERAFSGCEKLESIYMPKVTEIPEGAFSENTNLKQIFVSKDFNLDEHKSLSEKFPDLQFIKIDKESFNQEIWNELNEAEQRVLNYYDNKTVAAPPRSPDRYEQETKEDPQNPLQKDNSEEGPAEPPNRRPSM